MSYRAVLGASRVVRMRYPRVAPHACAAGRPWLCRLRTVRPCARWSMRSSEELVPPCCVSPTGWQACFDKQLPHSFSIGLPSRAKGR